MNRTVAIALLGCLLTGCAARTTPTAPAANLNDLAAKVELRLVANQDTCKIPHAKTGENLPAAPVDLRLELINRSGDTIVLPIGTSDWYTFKLEGPGAKEGGDMGMWCIPSPDLTVEAGKTHTVDLRHLRYYRGKGRVLSWTKPGEYTLTAEARVKVDGHQLTICSAPLKLQVVEGPAEPPPGEKPAAAEAKRLLPPIKAP